MEKTKNEFQIVKYRLKIDNPNILLVQCWFTENEVEESDIFFLLGEQRLIPKVSVKEGIEIRKKHLNESYNIDREYYFWIPLPEDINAKQCVRVFQKIDNKEKLVYAIPCAKIISKQKKIDKYIEETKIADDKINIKGWYVADKDDVEICILDERNRKIEFAIKDIFRNDVVTEYPEAKQGQVHGFNIEFMDKGYKKVTVVMIDGQRKSEFQCNVRPSLISKGTKKVVGLSKKTLNSLSQNGVKTTTKLIIKKIIKIKENDYMTWRKKYILSSSDLEKQKAKKFEYQPRFSIVVPLYKTPEKYLREFIASVENQTYSNWELCLSDGSGENSPIEKILKEYEEKDERIKIVRNDNALQISENTNEAIAIASGDYIAFADHDDLLTPDALFECVKVLNQDRSVEAIYSDEDKVTMDGKEYFEPHFKTDFNIELLCSMNYICHLYVVSKQIIDKIGVLNKEYDGAQDYDFILRSVEVAQKVYHIPRVLYHWRAHKDSTAENPESKMYAFEAGARAIQAHYNRVGIKAKVHQGEYLGLYKTEHIIDAKPMISIIIPNKDHIDDLEKCINSIERKSHYENYEYIIIENNSEEEKTFEYYQKVEAENSKVHVVYWKDEFNYSAINNFGVKYAKGDYLLFLNNDTEIINDNCLEELVGYCMHEGVGAVGARLYYSDNTIQHAGVIVGFGGIAGHAFLGLDRSANGYFSRIICAQDLSAVTAACMMVKKEVFEEIGGFDTDLKVAFNDVDLCMKIRTAGYRIVYNPYAELYHYESKSRGLEDTPEKVERFNGEIATFAQKWPEILKHGDPYYNPNLSMERGDFGLK